MSTSPLLIVLMGNFSRVIVPGLSYCIQQSAPLNLVLVPRIMALYKFTYLLTGLPKDCWSMHLSNSSANYL